MRSGIPSLSDKETVVLELLTRDGEMYGLELVSASEGALKRGTVYVTLGRMEEKGYVKARPEEPPLRAGGMPRRVYSPTPLGREVLRAWATAGRQLAARLAR
jgi:PadR family transcriptional regulator PadR